MRSNPIPRREAFDLYWKFAAERQKIFELRLGGAEAPWTADPILQTYKFCNVYRASDRVSQYLIRNVAYCEEECRPEDRAFQIVAFRMFSRISTWERVRSFLGRSPLLEDLRSGRFEAALDYARSVEGGLYTGAFILCATNAYGQRSKHLNHVELFKHMFLLNDLGQRIVAAESLREVYEALHQYPLMGDFMSYQIAVDLNYSTLINFDEDDFTQPGPGAIRGIRKCFHSLGDLSPAEVIQYMVDNQEDEFEKLGLTFNGLWGRRLRAIDCQGLFCETDKYCRVALPELTSARVRIKSTFSPQRDPLPLFYPPKWGINHLLPETEAETTQPRELVTLF